MSHISRRRVLAPFEYKDGGDDPLVAIRALGATLEEKFGLMGDEVKKLRDQLDQEIVKGKRPATETKSADDEIEAKAFDTFVRKGREGLTADEVKSLRVSDDTAGGILAPDQFITELDRNVVLFNPIRSIARVMPIGTGAAIWPKRTGGMTATWTGEGQDEVETNVTFGATRYEVRELTAYVDVTNAQIEDSTFDVNSLLAEEFGEEFGRAEGVALVDGASQLSPSGFMQNAAIGYTPGGDASALKADGLIDLYHALATPYRADAVWLMNSTTLGACRKLKDGSSGQYLLMTAGIGNAPMTTLLGRPVIECPSMPDVGSGAYPIIFGNFTQGYRIFDRIPLSILRDPFSVAKQGMVRFHGRRRVAGGVGKAEALRKLKIATS